MAVFFIFSVGVLNLGMGFGAAVVIKRRYEARMATEPTEQEHDVAEPDMEEEFDLGVNETAEEAVEAVEDLLANVGLSHSAMSSE